MDYPFLKPDNELDEKRLQEIMNELAQCSVGKQLIKDAIKHKTTIAFDGAMRAYGSYDEVKNHLRLNPSCSKERLVGTLAHELRHAQQFQKGILMDAYLDTPKCYIQNQAVIEADASTTATHACYELAMMGKEGPLESLREKDAHIVNPFQNAAMQGGLKDGSAHKAAFMAWFTDYSTRDSYDILYCKMFTQRAKNSTRAEDDVKMERVVPVTDITETVCTHKGKPYLNKKEAEDFFKTEDASSVSYERFNSIYANLYFKYNLDYKLGAEESLKAFGLYVRPHSGYMPSAVIPEVKPLPSLADRQVAAAEKIAKAKERKEKKAMSAAVLKAKKGLEK